MASTAERDNHKSARDVDSDSDSDFGYDLSLEDEELLACLADGTSIQSVVAGELTSAAQPLRTPQTTEVDHHATSTLHNSPRGKASLVGVARTDSVDAFVRRTQPQPTPNIIPAVDVQYPDRRSPLFFLADTSLTDRALLTDEKVPVSGALNSLDKQDRAPEQKNPATLRTPSPPQDDRRPPLLRFRTFPKKPLSVSDLTAGAWCELQYEYTLTRLPGGKKTRTAAMKEGSKVHQKLEDEVHTTVQVEIASREDAFGLKVWNIIQGLRTLRETGLTRELEVWGLVDGNVVNGLIDFLSHQNPDRDFEEEWLSSQGSRSGDQDESQKKITNFFPTEQPAKVRPQKTPKVYLTDVKTRGSSSLPKGAAVRPTKVQLFLYHRFLADMVEDKINFLEVFERYGLDVDAQFSDSFLAQVGELHDDVFHDSSSVLSSTSAETLDTDAHDLLRYRTLRELVPLLRSELRLTLPAGAQSLGSVVTVEYRLRGEEGALIGSNVLAVDAGVLDQYLESYMEWWRGERSAAGVDVEEAYKCSSCEFAEICSWREEMDNTNLKRAREKSRARAGPASVLDATPRTGSKSPRARRRKSTSPASPG